MIVIDCEGVCRSITFSRLRTSRSGVRIAPGAIFFFYYYSRLSVSIGLLKILSEKEFELEDRILRAFEAWPGRYVSTLKTSLYTSEVINICNEVVGDVVLSKQKQVY